jgi:hypothetical protein
MAYLAKNLSPEQRLAIESLLGRAISEREAITIRAYEPAPPVSDQRRQEIIEGLEANFAALDAKREPVSAKEAEAIFEEAMRSTRPNYRTHR